MQRGAVADGLGPGLSCPHLFFVRVRKTDS